MVPNPLGSLPSISKRTGGFATVSSASVLIPLNKVTYSDVDSSSGDATRAGKSQDRLVVSSVTEGHSISLETRCQTQNLVSHTNTKDGFVPFVDGNSDSLDGIHDTLWVSWSVGQEQSVVLIPDGVEVIVPWQDSDDCVSSDERSKDVGLGSKVQDGNLGTFTVGVQSVGFRGGHSGDEVLLGRVPELLGWTDKGVVANSELTEGGTLVSEERSDGSSVDTRDTWHIVPSTPLVQRFHSLVVRVFQRHIGNNHTGTLDSLRLEEWYSRSIRQRLVGRYTVVTNHRRSEDQNLTEVRRIGHGIGIRGDGRAEHRLTEFRFRRTKRLTMVRLTGFEVQSSGRFRWENVSEEVGVHGRSEASSEVGLEAGGRRRCSEEFAQHDGRGIRRVWILKGGGGFNDGTR